jgi:hypothetical protein
MSQGVGTYIRGIASVIENKITPSMRKVANQVLPVLATELNKIRFGAHPIYDFNKEKDGMTRV